MSVGFLLTFLVLSRVKPNTTLLPRTLVEKKKNANLLSGTTILRTPATCLKHVSSCSRSPLCDELHGQRAPNGGPTASVSCLGPESRIEKFFAVLNEAPFVHILHVRDLKWSQITAGRRRRPLLSRTSSFRHGRLHQQAALTRQFNIP